jgi:hypothetical protein
MAPRKRSAVNENQLDLFADSEDVGRRNAVIAALLARDARKAADAIQALAAALPTDGILGAASLVHAHLIAPTTPITDHASASSELGHLQERIGPAADSLFGRSAALEWMRSEWLSVAERIDALSFDARWPEVHTAALLCTLARWEEGLGSALSVPNWRRLASPLSWVAQCRCHRDGINEAWPLLAELAWLSPVRFAQLAPILPASGLHRLQETFEREFHRTVTDYAWFPAWSLIAYPDLRLVIASAQGSGSPPEQCFRTVLDLLILERKGVQPETIPKRKALHGQNPELFEFFMETRC